MKKVSKVISVLMIALMIFAIATNVKAINPGSIKPNPNVNGVNTVTNVGEDILGIIQAVGSVVAVGILIVLAIKYMMGSAEEKAEYKKTLIPYVVGAVILFSASTIAGMVYEFAQNL